MLSSSNLRGNFYTKINILGNIKNSKFLTDSIINVNNYGIFNYSKNNNFLICALQDVKYINEIILYVIDNVQNLKLSVDVSQNLFKWEKVKFTIIKENYKKGIFSIKIDLKSKCARFVRISFLQDSQTMIRISEIKVDVNTLLKVKDARIKVVNVGKNWAKLKIVSDIETMCEIKYGASLNKLASGPLLLNYSKENIVTLNGLLKGTEYFVTGIIKDCNNNLKYTPVINFKTKGIPLPLFKQIKVKRITSKEVFLDFKSNIPTIYEFYCGYSKDELKKYNYSISFSKTHSLGTLPDNIGRFAKIKGDFTYIGENLFPRFAENSIYRLVDGKYDYFRGSVMSGNINQKDQKVFFDLQKTFFVKRIDLVWWKLMYSTNFDIKVSENEKKWITIGKNLEINENLQYPYKIDIPYFISRVLINKKLRYIKIICKKGKYRSKFPQYFNLRLLEVFIIGKEKRLPLRVEFLN